MPTDKLSNRIRRRMAGAAHARDHRWRPDPSRPVGTGVAVTVDGETVVAPEGQALAVALALAGRLELRRSPAAGTPRGMFCLMGSCQECLVHVDGEPRLACLEPVRAGMQVQLDRLRQARDTVGG